MNAAAFTMRCPHCAHPFTVDSGAAGARGSTVDWGASSIPQNRLPAPTESIICPSCKRSFRLAEALPASISANLSVPDLLAIGKPEMGPAGWLICLLAGAAVYSVATMLVEGVRGPAFLALYAVVWIVLFGLGWLGRLTWRDGFAAMVIGFLVFEAVGIQRFLWGSAHGMQNWNYMWLMMLFGGMAFFVSGQLRRHDQDGIYGGNCSSFSWFSGCASGGGGGGGCGGGGCGGGGCGGCGG